MIAWSPRSDTLIGVQSSPDAVEGAGQAWKEAPTSASVT